MSHELGVILLLITCIVIIVGIVSMSCSIDKIHKQYTELNQLKELVQGEIEKKSTLRTGWGIILKYFNRSETR